MALASGTRVGIYEVTAKIGEGGMGEVYRAHDTTLDRDVALKVLSESFTADPDRLARFQREAKVLASLNHPNIGGIYGLEVAGASQALVLELIEGPTLADRIKEGPIPVEEALTMARQIADALEVAHDQGIVHRDLKPQNILVDSSGQPKVIDFGVARSTDSDLAVTTLQTDVGQLIGTLQYMSPEQCEADPSDIDVRSDVYALGVILYELLTGKLPYDLYKKVIHEAVRIVREEEPEKPSAFDRRLRGDIETIALKALEKNRLRRYQSAVELNQDIQHYLDDEHDAEENG